MKRCPQCHRVETDEALKFCRVDGTTLVSESASLGNEAGTAQPGSQSDASEVHTSILPHTTGANINRDTAPTTALPQRPAASTTSELSKPNRRKTVIIIAVLVTAAVAATSAVLINSYRSRKSSAAIQSIAVMPFVNGTGNVDVEYLSDGMTETLISNLSQLPNLNVKPRSSVFRYKGKETNPQTIAKELNVQAILNGRVVQRGQDLSLFVELIDISLDKVVWSETYNRKQTDLVTLQTEIARDVSGKIKTKLSGEEIAKVTKTYTTNPEAYQLYLKGNFYRTKYTEEGYKKGIEFYKQALEVDPNYALAYYGIAEAYMTASEWYLSPNDAEPKAKAAAQKALEHDEGIAGAHYLLGKVAFFYDWDWKAVEREMKRANELDPSFSNSYATYLSAMGRFDEAIKTAETNRQRDPLDRQYNYDLAFIYLYAGRLDEAAAVCRQTLGTDPDYWGAYENLGLVLARKKQFPEAIAALEKARSLDNNPEIAAYLGFVYAAAGKRIEAQKVMDDLKELSKQRFISPYYIAIIYGELNDKEQAFQWLERAYEVRSGNMPGLKMDVVLDNLRPDPRFKDFLKRMNLPE